MIKNDKPLFILYAMAPNVMQNKDTYLDTVNILMITVNEYHQLAKPVSLVREPNDDVSTQGV